MVLWAGTHVVHMKTAGGRRMAAGVPWKLSWVPPMYPRCYATFTTKLTGGTSNLLSLNWSIVGLGPRRAHGHVSTSVSAGIPGSIKDLELRGRSIWHGEQKRTTLNAWLASPICFSAMEFASGFDSFATGGIRCSGDNTLGKTAGVAQPARSCKVAIIGAGAAGLVAARELIREGHNVLLFEQTESVGGVWVYDPNIEIDDLLGVNKIRKRVHSSMYASLRTNLPREIMGYTDFPFLPRDGRDDRRFPGHAEVAFYLEDFAEQFSLLDVIEFSTVVEYVGLCKSQDRISWEVRTKRRGETKDVKVEFFDAVVVCNGHYSEPKLAEIPGLSKWPGVQMHSHNYREPSSFTDKIVVVIGNAASGEDISREIANVAKEVHVSGRTWGSSVDFSEPVGEHGNIWRHSTIWADVQIECACENGTVNFKSGGSVSANIVLHCTGYFYYFPFLDTKGEVGVDENCVGPLYEHVFPPSLAPSLSFVGLPWMVVPFQLCELQSRWIAMALSNKISLPSTEEMMDSVQNFYAKLEDSGKPKRLAHNMATTLYDYDNWLADRTGSAPVETWRIKIYEATSKNKRQNSETYRDVWLDEELHQEAYARLKKIDPAARNYHV